MQVHLGEIHFAGQKLQLGSDEKGKAGVQDFWGQRVHEPGVPGQSGPAAGGARNAGTEGEVLQEDQGVRRLEAASRLSGENKHTDSAHCQSHRFVSRVRVRRQSERFAVPSAFGLQEDQRVAQERVIYLVCL